MNKTELTNYYEKKLNSIDGKEMFTEFCLVTSPYLFTVKEVAKILKTNPDYVYNLIKSKLLPVLKIGSYKIRAEALSEFLKKYENKDISNPFDIKLIQ